MNNAILKTVLSGLTAISLVGCASLKSEDKSLPVVHAPYVQLTGNLPSGTATVDPKESVNANIELATAYLQARQFKTSEEIIKIALSIDPRNATALMLKALVQSELKDNLGAEETFKTALNIDSRNVDINHNYGVFLCKIGKYSEGRGFLGIALQQPRYERQGNSFAATGTCFEKEGNLIEATANYKKSLNVDPNNLLALLSLAKLHYESANYELARTLMQRVSRMIDTPTSLELSMKIADKLNNTIERNSFADALERRFPESEQAKRLHEQQ